MQPKKSYYLRKLLNRFIKEKKTLPEQCKGGSIFGLLFGRSWCDGIFNIQEKSDISTGTSMLQLQHFLLFALTIKFLFKN
jgi:hypothetical protein